MIKKIFFLFIILFLVFSCKTKIETKVDKIEKKNIVIAQNDVVVEKKIEIPPKEFFNLEIDVINGKSDIIIDSINKGQTPLKLELEKGLYDITLSRKDYPDQICRVDLFSNKKVIFRHQKNNIPFKEIGIFSCGDQPKQVIFSPDDRYIYLPLLDDDGFQIFDMHTLAVTSFVKPPDPKYNKGFAEGLFIKEKNVFFVSQMNTGTVYEYNYPELNFIRSVSTEGKWSKYIAWSEKLQAVAVSNWASNDISIIDYQKGEVIKKVKTSQAPRGLAFSDDGNYLYILSFEGGKILKVDTTKWKEVKSIYKRNAAMRHIVLTKDNTKAYVSNMYHNEIYEIDLDTFKIITTYKVFDNPNTIDITNDDRYLFVSSRGPNNSESYLERSPVDGIITVIDLQKKEIIYKIRGGNQPTGLDISNDGNYLCFSNFRDKDIEIYWIGDLYGKK
ncbi:MAG: hypothetical protein A2086_10245 [Spirochaetes bacterium GWD1_27_9]|nr:MAG: hypothetical protein A2Y34_09195 [Spirochaetes bacterium GWC1_27_15]OHD43266.1 MAG: hypothetical protein A2086_10245 [Spirochaetes bacterium GWD1_27_9]